MPEFDLAIRGGTVVTAGDTVRADIGVRDGRIVAVAAGVADAARVIDASGLLVLPGGIDSHVHIAQDSGPGIVMADEVRIGAGFRRRHGSRRARTAFRISAATPSGVPVASSSRQRPGSASAMARKPARTRAWKAASIAS